MKNIFKYPLTNTFINQFSIQIDRILTVQIQNNIPCLWVLIDDKKPAKSVCVTKLGTGWEIDDEDIDMSKFTYINTVQEEHTNYVWHFFYTISD